MFEGVGFIWRARIILATITLDLFAVLLGGAVGLLPVYAKDIPQHRCPVVWAGCELCPSSGRAGPH
jgi:hypothetical protein